jgi:hypothetical protein
MRSRRKWKRPSINKQARRHGDKLPQYTQIKTAEAIPIAATNTGGLAGAGAGLGAGVAIGSAMGQAMAGGAAPPPPMAAAGARWSVIIDGKTYGPLRRCTRNGRQWPGISRGAGVASGAADGRQSAHFRS